MEFYSLLISHVFILIPILTSYFIYSKNKDGKMNGLYRKYDYEGKLETEGNYKDSLIIGRARQVVKKDWKRPK